VHQFIRQGTKRGGKGLSAIARHFEFMIVKPLAALQKNHIGHRRTFSQPAPIDPVPLLSV